MHTPTGDDNAAHGAIRAASTRPGGRFSRARVLSGLAPSAYGSGDVHVLPGWCMRTSYALGRSATAPRAHAARSDYGGAGAYIGELLCRRPG